MAEFWRDLRPIKQHLQGGARCPRCSAPNMTNDDERYYVPLKETVGSAAVDLVFPEPLVRHPYAKRPRAVIRHYHPHRSSPLRSPASGAISSLTGSPSPVTSSTRRPARRTRSSPKIHPEPMKVHFKVTGPADLARRARRAGRTLRRHDYIALAGQPEDRLGAEAIRRALARHKNRHGHARLLIKRREASGFHDTTRHDARISTLHQSKQLGPKDQRIPADERSRPVPKAEASSIRLPRRRRAAARGARAGAREKASVARPPRRRTASHQGNEANTSTTRPKQLTNFRARRPVPRPPPVSSTAPPCSAGKWVPPRAARPGRSSRTTHPAPPGEDQTNSD